MAGRAFWRGWLSNLPLFKQSQPAKKGLGANLRKSEKDLGKEKAFG